MTLSAGSRFFIASMRYRGMGPEESWLFKLRLVFHVSLKYSAGRRKYFLYAKHNNIK